MTGPKGSKARSVTVRLSDFAFTPDHLAFEAGTPVRLILVNAGSGTHDFAAPRFFATVAYRQGTDPVAGGDLTPAQWDQLITRIAALPAPTVRVKPSTSAIPAPKHP